MANRFQRFLQRSIGITPSANTPSRIVIKSWKNTKNPHLLEQNDKVLFDTPEGTLFTVYTGGDEKDESNYKDKRIFSN